MEIKDHDKILLVGEGNFSFTIALMNNNIHRLEKFDITASCYKQYSDLSEEVKLNAFKAYKLGADIWFGIDARNLHLHEALGNCSYSKIIFNFPHIGGKMRIELNRQLLKDFFTSASMLLTHDGTVIVTLCKGQGGTCYDKVERKYEDTWKVTEMATYGDLILKQVFPFIALEWSEYSCSGYRSLEKGFNTVGSLTYVFQKSAITFVPPVSITFKPNSFHCVYIEQQIQECSPSLKRSLEVELFKNNLKHIDIPLKLVDPVVTICLCKVEIRIDWWYGVLQQKVKQGSFLGLVCQPCHSKNDYNNVENVILINTYGTIDVGRLFDFIKYQCISLQTASTITDLEIVDYKDVLNNVLFASKCRFGGRSMIAIFLNEVVKLLENFPYCLKLPQEHSCDVKSLCPPTYTHHLSFWVSATFSIKKFACALKHVGRGFVKCFQMIDEYFCDKSKRSSVCYSITYCSLTGALSPSKAWQFHCDIVANFIRDTFDVTIR